MTLDEGINDPDWVVLGDPVIQPLWEQQALRTRLTFNESAHRVSLKFPMP